MLQKFTRMWKRGGKYTRGCMALSAASVLLIICSICIVFGQAVGIVPDYQATRTVEAATKAANKQAAATEQVAGHQTSTAFAAETAVILALTPSATPTSTSTSTMTWTPSATPSPSNTPTASRTPIPATPAPQITELPRTTYYAITGANLRTCPRVSDTCEPVAQLAAGDRLDVTGVLVGDAISGNAVWYQAHYSGQTVYVHSSVLSNTKPAAPAPVVQSTRPPSQPVVPAPEQPQSGVACGGASRCTEMTSCEQAYACLQAGYSGLDRDKDGVPCEDICPGG